MAITDGNGANLVFDPVAGPMLTALAQATARGGTIFVYGALAPAPTPYPLMEALGKGLSIQGYTLFEITGDPARMASGEAVCIRRSCRRRSETHRRAHVCAR